jgi:hypothetical protein
MACRAWCWTSLILAASFLTTGFPQTFGQTSPPASQERVKESASQVRWEFDAGA